MSRDTNRRLIETFFVSYFRASIICFKELISRGDCEQLRNKLEEEETWSQYEDEELFPETLQKTVL